MLISLTIENWMSFRERTCFSMVASRERQHRERVAKLAKYRTSILPVAAIYGGNASGKTNFFKAIGFAKRFVTKGTRPNSPIPTESFSLDTRTIACPSRFEFELLVGGDIYVFSFVADTRRVLEERLVLVKSTSETVLYDRRAGNLDLADSLAEQDFLHFAFRGTRDNQLYLTNAVSQKVEVFRPVYDWFEKTLDLVAPDSRFEPFERFLDESHPLYSAMSKCLPLLDTGIDHLGGEEIPFDDIPVPAELRAKLAEEVAEGTTVRVMDEVAHDRYVITRTGERLVAKKLVAYHSRSDGDQVRFDMCQESDGSRRVVDLVPAFLQLSDRRSCRVIIVDELDRSLHTLLTRQLLELYLQQCSPGMRSQLLFTTHDVLLMDQDLLRRDEMWVVERDQAGTSTLMSFSEYKDVRYDRDLRKSYLQGRLGGIPRLLLGCMSAPVCGKTDDSGENR